MTLSRWVVFACLAYGVALGQDASVPPAPVSTNPDDAPARVKSGKVFASTEIDRPPALGPTSAKVWIVVFSDFQCPVCKRSADATQQIAEEFPGEVRVLFWQHPLASHAGAEGAAVASLAAQQQGKFWEYHDEVFRNQSALDADSLSGYASRLGLDVDRFKSDSASPELHARVKSEAAFAERFGATSTPAFMMNGKVHTGWGSWYGFRGEVEHELAEARKLEAAGTPAEQIAGRRAQAQIEDADLLQAYREQILREAQEAPTKKGSHKDRKKEVKTKT